MKKRILTILFILVAIFILTGTFLSHHIFADMYNITGEKIKVFSFNMENYREKGWYEAPVTKVYATENKSEIIYTSNLGNYKSNGWYEKPVTCLFNTDGESKTVYTSESKNFIANGWYTEPVALMINKDNKEEYIPVSEISSKRNDGWFIKEFNFGLGELKEQIKEYTGKSTDKIGLYIKNLTTKDTLVLNDSSHRSASVIKLFQMAALYSEIEKGNLENNDYIHKYMDPMITLSDNFSSNYVVNIIGQGNYKNGFDTENRFAKSIGCYATQHLSLFLGCGYFTSLGSNRTSPYDCGILLEKIYNRTLVSPNYSDEMLNLLKRQTRREKIPYYLPDDTVIANKTGETDTLQNDVGIVYSPGCDYIICIFTNGLANGIETIRQISRITYDYFN